MTSLVNARSVSKSFGAVRAVDAQPAGVAARPLDGDRSRHVRDLRPDLLRIGPRDRLLLIDAAQHLFPSLGGRSCEP